MSIGTFGPVTFEVSDKKVRSFSDFKRKTGAKFEEHALIGLKPKLEFTAPQLDDISFQVVFSAYLGLSPSKEIDQLRGVVHKGEYHPLIVGGNTMGKFVVESLSESWKNVDNQGQLIHAALDVSLKEYIESSSGSAAKTTITLAATLIKVEGLAGTLQSLASSVGLNAAAITGLAETTIAAVKDRVSAITGATGLLTNIKGLQDVSKFISLEKNKDFAGAISAIMGGSVDSYKALGLSVKDIVTKASVDAAGAITDILTQVSAGGEPVYTAAKDIFGGAAAGPIMLMSQRVNELKQSFEKVKL